MLETYVIMPGDTLSSIANKYNISEEIIKQFNGYDIELIPGMKLLIPKRDSKYFNYYVIKKGDTLLKIARDNNINGELLARLNGLNITDYIYPEQVLLVPKTGSMLYFTAVGDTLESVTKIFNTSVDDLIRENENIYLQPEQLIVYGNK